MSQPRAVTLYLHVHQPWRVRQYSIFDTAERHDYFACNEGGSDVNNEYTFKKVADKSYRPMNALLEKLLAEQPEFKLSLSITGTFIEQAEEWAPDVLESFQRMVRTGRVEIVAETYYHSLAYFYSIEEFDRQVTLHRDKIREVFGVEMNVFRGTELAYNDELAKWAETKGYKGILAEGWDAVLGWRSPNFTYRPAGTEHIALLLKNYRLSDDIAFRFSNHDWAQWPLTAEKYDEWVNASAENGSMVNLFMDYETFGEHQWADTGIFEFFEGFVTTWLREPDHAFYTVSEAIAANPPEDELSIPDTITWADTERDLSAWLGSSMQQEAMKYLYALEDDIMRSGDEALMGDWRRLQTSDHTYYMSRKSLHDGEVHSYFSPYESPYDAFLYFMNALRDVRYRLMEHHDYGAMRG